MAWEIGSRSSGFFAAPCRSGVASLVVWSRERQEPTMIEFKPRHFVLPAIAVIVLALLHAPADGGKASDCAALRSVDAGIRASFLRFGRTQSGTAAKICQMASNTLP
jgi:hypothetical protein